MKRHKMAKEMAKPTLKSVIFWEQGLPVLEMLAGAIHTGPSKILLTPNTAICFDSNVFLHIGKGNKAAEIIDYLGTKHLGPIILPSQVVLEFWNNHLIGLEAFAADVVAQFEQLTKTINNIDKSYSNLKDGANKLAEEFREEFGFIFETKTSTDLQAFLQMLSKKAIISQVSRNEYAEIASIRKRTKTPPGFKDSGDGDFYVWAEFLNGLVLANNQSQIFDQALLVTNDVKKDWSTQGIPHPILSAELSALVAVPFCVMTLNEFRNAVQQSL